MTKKYDMIEWLCIECDYSFADTSDTKWKKCPECGSKLDIPFYYNSRTGDYKHGDEKGVIDLPIGGF